MKQKTRPLQYIIYRLQKLAFYPTSSLLQKFTSSLPEGNSKVNFYSCLEFEENSSFCSGLKTLFFLVGLFSITIGKSQPLLDSLNVLEMTVVEGDTIPLFRFPTVSVYPPLQFKNARQRKRYSKLKRYVIKVYPYAEIAGEMLKGFDDTLKTIKSEAKRKRYMKKVEKELKMEFEGELRKLTIKQGIILVKLIDRETGTTSYDLIKTFRGAFSAFVWQSLARLFGSNLKLEYDPEGEDVLIEEIVRDIERGKIPYNKRKRTS